MTEPRRIGAAEDDGDDLLSSDDTSRPTQLDDVKDGLFKALAEQVARLPVTLPVSSRRGVTIRYDTNLDSHLLQTWNRKSTDRKSGAFDALRNAKFIIANQAESVLYQDREPSEPLNFRTPELRERVGGFDVADTVDKVFGGDDALVIATGNAIIRAAGYSADADDELLDPTTSD